MDPLVAAALVGTGQRPADHIETAPDLDKLFADPLTSEAERALLLRAGAWSVYRQAGTLPAVIDATSPAPDERLEPCSPDAAILLRRIIDGQMGDVLLEALERLRQSRLRLPFDLLPAALNIRDAEQRAALAPVLGERGRWLSQFNKGWSWVAQTLDSTGGDLPADAETIWQEGAAGQRVEVLRRLRSIDPSKAREWLDAVWKREKAEVRADLLGTLEVGLGPEDEPLLEQVLDDRAERPRSVAQHLLLTLPDSKLAARMRERATATLTYANGKLDAKPPTAGDATWTRDGLRNKPPQAKGEREFLLREALTCVPPTHWEQHFGLTPDMLLAATDGSKWRIAIVECWTDAAERFKSSGWAAPLWRFWSAATDKEIKQANGSRGSLLTQVLPLAAEADREAWALAALANAGPNDDPTLDDLLGALPRPWSEAVGTAYVRGLQAFAATLTEKSKSAEPWDDTLQAAGIALPRACFAEALQPIEIPATNHWYMQNFRRQLDSLADVLRTRQRIYEEIPA
jgi:hypothetical protein